MCEDTSGWLLHTYSYPWLNQMPIQLLELRLMPRDINHSYFYVFNSFQLMPKSLGQHVLKHMR